MYGSRRIELQDDGDYLYIEPEDNSKWQSFLIVPAVNEDKKAFSIYHSRKNKESCFVTALEDGLF